ncbi:peptidase S8, partial [Burkholderia contaminans]
MRTKRFNFALARSAHARMLAGMLSAAALLPLAGCGGGGGGDGSNPSSSNAAPAPAPTPSPAPSTPTSPPASSGSNACTNQQAAVPIAAHSTP